MTINVIYDSIFKRKSSKVSPVEKKSPQFPNEQKIIHNEISWKFDRRMSQLKRIFQGKSLHLNNKQKNIQDSIIIARTSRNNKRAIIFPNKDNNSDEEFSSSIPFSPTLSPTRDCVDMSSGPTRNGIPLMNAVEEEEGEYRDLDLLNIPTPQTQNQANHLKPLSRNGAPHVEAQDLFSPARGCVYDADTSHNLFNFSKSEETATTLRLSRDPFSP